MYHFLQFQVWQTTPWTPTFLMNALLCAGSESPSHRSTVSFTRWTENIDVEELSKEDLILSIASAVPSDRVTPNIADATLLATLNLIGVHELHKRWDDLCFSDREVVGRIC